MFFKSYGVSPGEEALLTAEGGGKNIVFITNQSHVNESVSPVALAEAHDSLFSTSGEITQMSRNNPEGIKYL